MRSGASQKCIEMQDLRLYCEQDLQNRVSLFYSTRNNSHEITQDDNNTRV